MSRWPRALVAVTALLGWAAGASAATTLKLPPPDLSGLVPLAALPLDKPPVALPAVPLPPPPQGLPELPPPRPVADAAQRPVVPLAPPRMLACNPLGTVLRVASELLECGRARYQREELEEAREAFDNSRPDAQIPMGSAEIWTFRNEGTQWSHPIHIHMEEFQILSINGVAPGPAKHENI